MCQVSIISARGVTIMILLELNFDDCDRVDMIQSELNQVACALLTKAAGEDNLIITVTSKGGLHLREQTYAEKCLSACLTFAMKSPAFARHVSTPELLASFISGVASRQASSSFSIESKVEIFNNSDSFGSFWLNPEDKASFAYALGLSEWVEFAFPEKLLRLPDEWLARFAFPGLLVIMYREDRAIRIDTAFRYLANW